MASSATAQPLLLANFTQSDLVGNTIIKGFTEMLENDVANGDEADGVTEDSRVAVINLLLVSILFTFVKLFCSHLSCNFAYSVVFLL